MQPNSIYVILLGLVAMTLAYKTLVYPFYVSPLRHLPGPKTLKYLHVSWIPDLYCEWSREWPEAPFIRCLGIANSETLFVNSIEAYKEILQTKSAYFVKPAFARSFAHEVIGDGLPFDEGQLHKLRRAAIMRAFSVPRLKASFPMVQGKAKQWTDFLNQRKDRAGDVEIETSIWQAILDVIGIVTFGQDFNHLESDRSPLFKSFSNIMQPSTFAYVVNYTNASLPIRKYLPIQEFRETARHRTKAREFIRAHVSKRLEALRKGKVAAGTTPDALQCLVEHSDPSWDEDKIVEYAVNLMVLGDDTTACSVVWAVHELSHRPQLQQRLRDEIENLCTPLESATHVNIEKLPLMHNFVREVLRMYCAVAILPREATRDIDIAGVVIPKGTAIQLSPAVMNLHTSVWGPTAADFDPDRWDSLCGAAASPYAFETFHNGPRMCIGKQLAMMEMKAMLVELVGRFRIEAKGEGPLEVARPTFTLRPKEKLVVRLVDFQTTFTSLLPVIALGSYHSIAVAPTMSRSLQLKEEGNRCFQAGDYVGADSLYSKAIIADSKNPALYTNRAMARLKLGYWDSVIADCDACLAVAPDNMKANYYLAQAQAALRDFDGALSSALRAHALCVATNDKSLAAVTALVLKCKKDRWDERERRRVRETRQLENEVLTLLENEKRNDIADAMDDIEQKEIEEEADAKATHMRNIFERARENSEKRREVPEWAIDDISFCILVDPVVTKTGKSYERASIMEHLRRHPSDPLTREPLLPSELRPNLALKQACEEFLEENGWAVDW
ncbi:hypothetical protein G7Z17_g8170 [Cylindrodendrum hubeiense]|uniref:peptidylprolyl isomerase n=1 Tax=Cylindrodendrum hubeiense TaxID=595255 RepID=A0A9P5H947_9HYPO|nr:hypothetical protein G7Z17_g8170 [Cylindrodendrum hubeiense]